MSDLWLSFLFGTFGIGYFIYGKRQSEFLFLLAGGLLMIYPYMVSGSLVMSAIGLALMAGPFVARRFL